jgi:hypothetical protein
MAAGGSADCVEAPAPIGRMVSMLAMLGSVLGRPLGGHIVPQRT